MFKAAFHVDHQDLQVFGMALGNIRHTLEAVSGQGQPFELTLVVTGPAILLTRDLSGDSAALAATLAGQGLRFEVCHNAMQNFGVAREALPACCQVVPAGIVRLVELQQAGAAYIKP